MRPLICATQSSFISFLSNDVLELATTESGKCDFRTQGLPVLPEIRVS
jgi:hypothetical protein